jgi:hypothetical protein
MQKNSNSWRLIAMFFAAFMLFVLGPIQGSPKAGHVPDNGYILYASPPIVQQSISVTEAVQPIQIARGVSVPILGEVMIVYLVSVNNVNFHQDAMFIPIDMYDRTWDLYTNKTKASSNSIHSYRAREKI